MGKELNFSYKSHILKKTHKSTMDVRRRWVTYEKILDEMALIGEFKKIDEIKYRITDGENDKKVFTEVLKKIKDKGVRLNLLTNSI
tara:strand:- start:15871 stop:16128 length:258 start_codon:yes stop_codon:yes gene_type:complete